MPDQILSIIIFLPIVSTFLIVIQKRVGAVVVISALSSAFTTILSLGLFFFYDASKAGLQFVHWIPDWILSGKLSVDYHVGLDGVSLLLFALTTFMFFLSSIASWSNIPKKIKEFHICLLVLETAVLGVFASGNLVLFYVFWELMVLPMVLMIGIWGGEERTKAALKYFLFSMAGSLFMLGGILTLYFKTGKTSIESLSTASLALYSEPLQWFLFFSFFLAFAIKIPLFPFHTWMPDVHTQAPTVGSVDLAGVLLKIGAYGFIRFCIPFFPEQSLLSQNGIQILAVIGIVYGSMAALVQTDIKRIIAYSSLSHLGFCILGIFSFTTEGVVGGMLQMVSHGISTGMIFLMIGMIYERAHTRNISEFGGLAGQMPVFSTFFLIAVLSSIGLPGTNGFVGEFLILIGAIKSNVWLGGIAATGVVLGALYLLWFVKRFLFGVSKTIQAKPYKDLSFREIGILSPLVVLIFWIGLYPKPFLSILNSSSNVFLNSASVVTIEERKHIQKDFLSQNDQRLYPDYLSLGMEPKSYEERLGKFQSKFVLPNFGSAQLPLPKGEDNLENLENSIESDFDLELEPNEKKGN
ncbi:complex I subunit 4 family protein [Leptospira biflexa]|uniref:complex I subunit 4 family protein n=1 Tax=Leptospira biflexa TaxID=172 RepID=UPI00108471FA|nr:NADH-quinone oxidoreductase subunit M [Leptospira biflexa]TGM34102.1 NADH-quinone oxidoreductase subunit M [Leptospira biflexa]TGM40241.1 NADH-quinone oxidoreductase subunit M [Leptospira biflexa]